MARVPAGWQFHLTLLIFVSAFIVFCIHLLPSSRSSTERNEGPSCHIASRTPAVGQVVIILIDALRPDFIFHSLTPASRTDGRCDHSMMWVPAATSEAPPRDEDPQQVPFHSFSYQGNRLTDIEELLTKKDSSDRSSSATASHVFGSFFVADAPTTTAQRLRALMTGTIPTFIEALRNFNADAVAEDNLVDCMNGSAIVVGDDTWLQLFPNTQQVGSDDRKGREGHTKQRWKSAHGFPSFDVADLDGNDEGVLRLLHQTLDTEDPTLHRDGDSAAKLIVMHFLGVDHAGHTFNARNQHMNRKLNQLNVAFRNVSQQLSRRYYNSATEEEQQQQRTRRAGGGDPLPPTLLMVLGDHGMTDAGDHGGSSPQETDSFLFAQLFHHRFLSTEPQQTPPNEEENAAFEDSNNVAWMREQLARRWDECHSLDDGLCRLRACSQAIDRHHQYRSPSSSPSEQRLHSGSSDNDNNKVHRHPNGRISAVRQIDLVPTIATLLGVPIPFSSRGRVIPELLALTGAARTYDELATVSACNDEQLVRSAGGSRCDAAPSSSTIRKDMAKRRGEYAAMEACLASKTKQFRAQGTEKAVLVIVGAMLMMLAVSLWALWRTLAQEDTLVRVGAIAVITLRWAAGFSNSTVVMEVDVIGALTVLWVLCCCALHGRTSNLIQTPSRRLSCGALLLLLRVVLPLGVRCRFHGTHVVATDPTAVSVAAPFLQAVTWSEDADGGAAMQGDLLFPIVASVAVLLLFLLTTTLPRQQCSEIARRRGLGACCCAAWAAVCLFSPLVAALAGATFCVLDFAAKFHRRPSAPLPLEDVPRHASHTSTTVKTFWLPLIAIAALCGTRSAASLTWFLVVMVVGSVGIPLVLHVLPAERTNPVVLRAMTLWLLAQWWLFAVGLQASASTIDWSPSTLLPSWCPLVCKGVLVLVRLWAPQMVTVLGLYATTMGAKRSGVCSQSRHHKRFENKQETMVSFLRGGPESVTASVQEEANLLLVLQMIQCTGSVVSAFVLQDHLMFFEIFAPKLLFDFLSFVGWWVAVHLFLLLSAP